MGEWHPANNCNRLMKDGALCVVCTHHFQTVSTGRYFDRPDRQKARGSNSVPRRQNDSINCEVCDFSATLSPVTLIFLHFTLIVSHRFQKCNREMTEVAGRGERM